MKERMICCLVCLWGLQAAWGQCDTTYITTNPDAPFNPENPAKANTFFDWRLPEYDLNYTVGGITISTTIPSPFYQLDNYNVAHLYLSEDYRPEDGWELIGRNLGYNDNGTLRSDLTNPYLILYNKYTGLMRVFLGIGSREDDYDALEFRTTFIRDNGGKRTALLDYADLPLNALQVFDTSFQHMVATTEFLHEEKKWMMAEFQMAYDPCTCINPSQLLIQGYLADTAYITISGQSFGSIQPIKMVNGKPQQQQLDVTAAYKKGKEGITAGVKMHKSLTSLISSLDTMTSSQDTASSGAGKMKIPGKSKSGIEQIALSLLDNEFLKKGLKFIPYVGEAIEILSVFTSGGKKAVGPQSVTLSPLSTSMTHKFSGHISSSSLYKTILINTPGSNWSGNQGDYYPFYDEVLGMFNVLREPAAALRSYNEILYDPEYGLSYERAYHQQIQMSEDLSYVVNPAVFDTSEVEVMAALVFPVAQSCLSWLKTPLVHVRGNTYRTPLLPVSCLRDLIVEFGIDTTGPNTNCLPVEVQLQLAVHLKPRGNDPDRQHVLFSGLYAMRNAPYTEATLGAVSILPVNPLSGLLGENVELSQIQLEGGKTYYASESIRIGPGVTVNGQGPVVLSAGRDISVLPGVTLSPEIMLETGLPALCNQIIWPARQAQIDQICTSGSYTARTTPAKSPDLEQSLPPAAVRRSPFAAFPNPFTDEVTLRFSLPERDRVSLSVLDLTGRTATVIWQDHLLEAGSTDVLWPGSGLAPGIYLAVLETSRGRQTLRVVKQ